MKKRIQLEIKPCCSNCYFCRGTVKKTNPCGLWKPDSDWFIRKLKAAEKKQDKEAKEAKQQAKTKPTH